MNRNDARLPLYCMACGHALQFGMIAPGGLSQAFSYRYYQCGNPLCARCWKCGTDGSLETDSRRLAAAANCRDE